jgi:two-component system sensor histidine kinase RegB
MANEVPPGSALAADVELLVSQAARCRDILAELARRPEADGGAPYHQLSLIGVIEMAAHPHRRAGIELEVIPQSRDGSEIPVTQRTPELIHGLGNLLQNAQQFARRKLTVAAAWSKAVVEITIADDGPGFPPGVLNRLGDPYVSGRDPSSGHMGLGIFIATALLERGGAELHFDNAPNGGAQVVVRWQRTIFSLKGPGQ